MPKYSACIYPNSKGSHWHTPIYPKISLIERYIQQWPDMTADVAEIVVLKERRRNQMPIIHGYYDWVDGKLKLDKSKPAFIHNVLYGLEN